MVASHQWGPGSSAKLMDADGQILAMFPNDSSDKNLSTSNPYSNETNPKSHRIQLLEFAVVFTYSTFTPDVHLNVNRFSIDWQEGIIKGLKPTKMLRRNKAVKVLLEKAFQKAKSESLTSRFNGSIMLPANPSSRPVDQLLPQSQSCPHHAVQSQQVLSQIQSHGHEMVHQTLNTDRRLLHGANELLQHLGPSSRPSSRNSVGPSMQRPEQIINSTTPRGPLQVLADGEPTANGIRGWASPSEDRSSREDSISSQPQDNTMNAHESLNVQTPQLAKRSPQKVRQGTTSPLLDPGEIADNQLLSKNASHPPSRKRPRESAEVLSEVISDDSHSRRPAQGVKPGSPSRKKQRIEETIQERSPEAVSSDQRAVEVSNSMRNQGVEPNLKSASNQSSVRTNPWQGLTTIRASDVNIPKDQVELLDQDLCWIPPIPGKPEPHGHVPPWLLKQWNNIARLRHELNQEHPDSIAAEERPATPISSQESSLSFASESAESEPEDSYSWDGSSPVKSPRNLPPESSPVRQPTSLRRLAVPETSSRGTGLDDQFQTTQSQENSQPPIQVTGQLSAPEASINTSAGLRSSNLDPSMDSTEGRAKDSNHLGDVEVQGSPAQLESQRLDQAPSASEKGSSTDSDVSESVDEQSDDDMQSRDASDEESVMENSVPFALGESLPPTQCSQAEEEARSEARPLSQSVTDHVQVAVTPLGGNNRPQTKLDNNQTKPASPQPHSSSQTNKNSSQSRVPNTYPYPGSHEKSQSSDDPTISSSLRSEDYASRAEIAVFQTQSSGTNFQSQGPYDPSMRGVVLESSEPSQRHHDAPCLESNTPAEPSNYPFASSADMSSSQLRDPTHGPLTQLSINEPMSSSHLSSSKLLDSSAARTYQSPSEIPLKMADNPQQIPLETPATQSAKLVARRSGFIGDLEKSVEAQEVYKKFCTDYPAYAGDYGHFTELCSRLQAVRAQGLLRRSNLWDDFIIMHLQQYPSYLDSCTSQMSTEPQSYENYFTTNFSKSVNRKRSLSGYTIEVVAYQFAPREVTPTQASSLLDPPSQTGAASSLPEVAPTQDSNQLDLPSQTGEAGNTSLATSFVDRFSNFHAHSFEEPVNHGLPVFHSGLPALDSHATSSMDTGSSSVLIKLEGSEAHPDEILCTQTAPISLLNSIPTLYNPRPDTAESHPTGSQSALFQDVQDDVHLTENQSANFEGEQDDVHLADSQSANVHVQDERDDISMAEVEETDNEEFDPDDTCHETASVELGDDTFISAASQSHADEVPETQLECEDEPEEEEEEGENWFVAMRHTWSRNEPVWSDHPTTPFKTWAEADQNVLSERRRRGGAKILLDEKGVIRRPTHR